MKEGTLVKNQQPNKFIINKIDNGSVQFFVTESFCQAKEIVSHHMPAAESFSFIKTT